LSVLFFGLNFNNETCKRLNRNKYIPEDQLLHAFKNGDIQAFNELFDQYGKRLLCFSKTYLKSEFEAEEIVQDVFLKIWINRHNLSDTKSFNSYIFTIAKNAILNTIRKSKSEQTYLEYAKFHPNDDVLLDDELNFRELELAYKDAIEKLSPRRKEIYKLSREKSLSNVEISQQLGLSVKTIENQMTSAIAEIKQTLQALGFSAIVFVHLFL
jgi:RNA polymerase sigma-70 factor, ECF subfamily